MYLNNCSCLLAALATSHLLTGIETVVNVKDLIVKGPGLLSLPMWCAIQYWREFKKKSSYWAYHRPTRGYSIAASNDLSSEDFLRMSIWVCKCDLLIHVSFSEPCRPPTSIVTSKMTLTPSITVSWWLNLLKSYFTSSYLWSMTLYRRKLSDQDSILNKLIDSLPPDKTYLFKCNAPHLTLALFIAMTLKHFASLKLMRTQRSSQHSFK